MLQTTIGATPPRDGVVKSMWPGTFAESAAALIAALTADTQVDEHIAITVGPAPLRKAPYAPASNAAWIVGFR